MFCTAGTEHNRSLFVVKRFFNEEFIVTQHKSSQMHSVVRLNDFLFLIPNAGK
ncbi:hypothetical protein [Alistipes sp.]|uniref:hypothetical protein n=1 Tax=Alistipes sp. TaxID=1872444 RepID=UPI0025B8E569|nr:hypothetical protein [Alistipes sp.]